MDPNSAENEQDKKPPVPDMGSNVQANDNTSHKKPVPIKQVPDTMPNNVVNEANSSHKQAQPKPMEEVPEAVSNAVANKTKSSNNLPKPTEPGLKPEPEEAQSLEATKALNPSPPPPPPPPVCRTCKEWQKSNCFIFSLCNIVLYFILCKVFGNELLTLLKFTPI